jgi:hypothetical protein
MAPRIAAILLATVAFVPIAAAGDPPPSPPAPQPEAQPAPAAQPQAIPDPPKKPPTKKAKADAKKHIAEGTKLYNIQQYAEAAEHYRAAYMLDPKPEYIYASAQAQRQAGNCEMAIPAYNAYLRTNPKDAERDKAQKNIERCEQDLKDKQAAAAVEAERKAKEDAVAQEAAKKAADAAAAKAAADAAEAKRRADEAAALRAQEEAKAVAARKKANEKSYFPGHIMLGLGVGAVAGGVFLFRGARQDINDYNAITSYDEVLAARDDADAAKTRQTLGVVTIGAGVGLIAGAVTYYVVHSRSAPQEAEPPAPATPATPTVSATIGHDHAGLVLSGSF